MAFNNPERKSFFKSFADSRPILNLTNLGETFLSDIYLHSTRDSTPPKEVAFANKIKF